MIEFAGWEMPLQYSGIRAEHAAVRGAAGLFDIGHMGQIRLEGDGATTLLDRLLTCACATLAVGRSAYGFLCNEEGGVIDDVIVYRLGEDRWFMVVNATNRERDLAWIAAHRHSDEPEPHDDTAEAFGLALQGPESPRILDRIVDSAADLRPRRVMDASPLVVARTGYTGEDGFEIFGPAERAVSFWTRCLEGAVPCGLGARDTLRLEMGYPLHGHEISETITPIEAGLERFVAMTKGSFIGREALTAGADRYPPRRLAAFRMAGPGPIPRAGCEVRAGGRAIGRLTSGTFSPSLAIGIGMGYVEAGSAAPGVGVEVIVRGRAQPAVVVERPMYRPGR